MKRIVHHLHQNVVGYVALFVALGGTSYAVASLPAGSVGARQLKNHSITPVKFDRHSIGAYVRAWAVISPGGHLLASRPAHARLISWDPTYHTGLLRWPRLSQRCSALSAGSDGFVRAVALAGPGRSATVQFETYGPNGQPIAEEASIAVVCPDP